MTKGSNETETRETSVAGYLSRAMACILLAGLFAAPAGAVEKTAYTPAQLALFDTPHLENISKPGTLLYDFRHSAKTGEGFEDRVELTVTKIGADGRKDLSFQYLSGERQRPYPALDGFTGNPLIMLFLQHDVDEMERAVGGASSYYRNRIRFAFRDKAELEQTTIEHGGRTLAATRITLRPFAGDSNQGHFQRFINKRYEFLLAPEVPGGIYSIRSVVPAKDNGGTRIENSVTFRASAS